MVGFQRREKTVKIGDGINANLVGKNGGRVVENARYDMYDDPLSRCQHNCSIQELHWKIADKALSF